MKKMSPDEQAMLEAGRHSVSRVIEALRTAEQCEDVEAMITQLTRASALAMQLGSGLQTLHILHSMEKA